MTQRVALINWKSNKNCDVDYQQTISCLLKSWGGVCCKQWGSYWDFDYTAWAIQSGIAFIEFDRNVAPLATPVKGLAVFYNDAPVTVPNNPNSYVWIELDPAKVADPLLICDTNGSTTNAQGLNIWKINYWPAYPTDRPIVKLARFDATGTYIDERQCLTLDDSIMDAIFNAIKSDIVTYIEWLPVLNLNVVNATTINATDVNATNWDFTNINFTNFTGTLPPQSVSSAGKFSWSSSAYNTYTSTRTTISWASNWTAKTISWTARMKVVDQNGSWWDSELHFHYIYDVATNTMHVSNISFGWTRNSWTTWPVIYAPWSPFWVGIISSWNYVEVQTQYTWGSWILIGADSRLRFLIWSVWSWSFNLQVIHYNAGSWVVWPSDRDIIYDAH